MGLYFAWLGFYNQMLVFPSIIGLLIFLYGVATAYVDDINEAGWELISWWDEMDFDIYHAIYDILNVLKAVQINKDEGKSNINAIFLSPLTFLCSSEYPNLYNM